MHAYMRFALRQGTSLIGSLDAIRNLTASSERNFSVNDARPDANPQRRHSATRTHARHFPLFGRSDWHRSAWPSDQTSMVRRFRRLSGMLAVFEPDCSAAGPWLLRRAVLTKDCLRQLDAGSFGSRGSMSACRREAANAIRAARNDASHQAIYARRAKDCIPSCHRSANRLAASSARPVATPRTHHLQ